jgi:hypothetical protein
MYGKRTLKLIKYYIGFGYFCKGTPFKWDATAGKIRHAEELSNIIPWVILLVQSTLISFGSFICVLIELRSLLNQKRLIQQETVFRVCVAVSCLFFLSCQMNIVHKRQEIVKALNQTLRIFKGKHV